jgi:hypothetical protein
MRAEAAEDARRWRAKRPPGRAVGIVVGVIVLIPFLWSVFSFYRADAVARRFDRVDACNGPAGPGTPPPCSVVLMQVTDAWSRGFMEVVPRRQVAHRWKWLTFTVDLVDADDVHHKAAVLDQPTLKAIADEDNVGVVEYGGRIVGISGPAGYFPSADNPDVIRDEYRYDTLNYTILVVLFGIVFVLIEVSGKRALARARARK